MGSSEKDDTVTNNNPEDQNKNEINNLSNSRDASWPYVLLYLHLNVLGLYGLVVLFTSTSFTTVIFTLMLTLFGILGATAGSHRLWAHQTYKANTFLRIWLMLCQTMAGQGSIYDWVQKHRLHHETFKTDDDPFYSNKDFLSAHVFAQIRNLSEKQEALLKKIDMSDLEQDKVVMFQKKFYWILYGILFVLLPINAPMEYWNDTVLAALFITFCLRYLIVINACWLINSAHFIWGLDKNNKPSDSNMIFLVTKSYWPHYHYMLPWDYQTGEFGDYSEDCTTMFIRVFAALGWASELQTVTSDAVKAGLTMAVDTDRPVVECIKLAAQEEMQRIPKDHYLDKDKYL